MKTFILTIILIALILAGLCILLVDDKTSLFTRFPFVAVSLFLICRKYDELRTTS